MKNDFSDIMSKKELWELLIIIEKKREDYRNDAIDAAEVEYNKRNSTKEEIVGAYQHLSALEQKELQNIDESLDTYHKIFFFILFWGIIPWLIAYSFKNDGYIRKYNESWKYMKYGFFSFLLIIIFISIISVLIS